MAVLDHLGVQRAIWCGRLMFGATTRRRNPALVSEWKEEFAAVRVPSVLRCLDRIEVPALVQVTDAILRFLAAHAG